MARSVRSAGQGRGGLGCFFWAPVGALVVLALLAALTHPGRVAVKTLLLLPDLFPESPVRPLTWFTPAPVREEYRFEYPTGRVEADVYRPADDGRHGAMVLLLGARPFPKRHPALVRFADGLARAGAVVMIPESSNLLEGRILPEEREAIVQAFQLLRSRPYVDPERVGFVGFSVGGSLVAIAAADERIRDQVSYLNAFGAYYDARDLLRAVLSRSLAYAGVNEPWQPSELTLQVLVDQVVSVLPDPAVRDLLLRASQGDAAAAQALAALGPPGRALLVVAQGGTLAEVDAALDQLPPAAQERLAAISPSRYVGGLRTDVFLMHDVGDRYIPYTESARMAAALPPTVLRRYTAFNLFSHVLPDKPVPITTFAPELAKLYLHVFLVTLELL